MYYPWACAISFFTFFDRIVDGPYQVESRFGIFVDFSVHDHIEATDGFFDRNQNAFKTGELFSHMEGLGQETLHFTGAGTRSFCLRRSIHPDQEWQ